MIVGGKETEIAETRVCVRVFSIECLYHTYGCVYATAAPRVSCLARFVEPLGAESRTSVQRVLYAITPPLLAHKLANGGVHYSPQIRVLGHVSMCILISVFLPLLREQRPHSVWDTVCACCADTRTLLVTSV